LLNICVFLYIISRVCTHMRDSVSFQRSRDFSFKRFRDFQTNDSRSVRDSDSFDNKTASFDFDHQICIWLLMKQTGYTEITTFLHKIVIAFNQFRKFKCNTRSEYLRKSSNMLRNGEKTKRKRKRR